MTPNVTRTVRRRLAAAGYSKSQIARGVDFARAETGYGRREMPMDVCFTLAVSAILYSDQQLIEGARFSA